MENISKIEDIRSVVNVVKVFTGPKAENMYREITKNTIHSLEFKNK